jgi:SAM-dependent methyltransferase
MNEDQRQRWNGDEAAHWVDHADQYDEQLLPFLTALRETLPTSGSDSVLDVGCGCGALSLAFAADAGGVTGLDISAPLLSVATARADSAGVTNAEFVPGDAQVMSFGTKFDIVTSRFGVMFFDDPGRAFTNLRSALRSGGRLGFACWQGLGQQAWLLDAAVAAGPFLPPADPGPSGPGMFALAEPDTVRAVLDSAGFTNIEIASFRTPMMVGGPGTVEDAITFFAGGGIARQMLDAADPASRSAAIEAVRCLFADRHNGTGVTFDAAAWIVTADAG